MDTTIWIALVGGIILGWLIEWIVDWLYWRRGIAGFYATEEELRGELDRVRQENVAAEGAMAELRSELDNARQQNTDAQGVIADQRSQLEAETAEKTAALAIAATVGELRSELDRARQENSDAQGEITELRSQLETTTIEKTAAIGIAATVGELRSELDRARQENSDAQGEITELSSLLEAEMAEKAAAVAIAATVEEIRSEIDRVRQENADAQGVITELRSQLETTVTEKSVLAQQLEEATQSAVTAKQSQRDDLEQIDGVGRVYEQKLFDAGIDTFAQLAVTPVTRLREIIQPASWQHVNFESWVEQARKFAEVIIFDFLPYRLEEIRGIGPTYAKRLNAAGVMTFSDLAHTSEQRLREIVAPRSGLSNTIDFADWIHQAHAFVALTTADRPPLPLERIKGIGPVFATRLDLAGIHTYADLAKASEEQLREIIGTCGLPVANLRRWIDEANDEVNGGVDRVEQGSNGVTVVGNGNQSAAAQGTPDESGDAT